MATYIADALEIITDDGTGIPVAYSNSDLGLAGDGHFYLITERFGLNGTPTITGDNHGVTTWYENILSRDHSYFSIHTEADFIEAGCIASNSGFSFSIVNTASFFNTLKTNGVYLSNREVRYYRVTASDTAGPFNFELRWSGVIEEQPFNETTQKITCIDNSKNIFRSIPSLAINNATFPNAPKDSLEKMIPISLGRVAYSPLINVNGSGDKAVLCKINGVDHDICASHGGGIDASNNYYLNLLTKGLSFIENDPRLVNKYLVVIFGGEKQIIKISENDASSTFIFSSITSEVTTLYLSSPINGYDNNTSLFSNSTSSKIWYFQVIDLSPIFISSKNSIFDFKENVYKRESLYSYNKDILEYEDVTQIKSSSSTSNILSTNYPGFSSNVSSLDSEESAFGFVNITPLSCTVVSNDFSGGTMPAIGNTAGSLIDVDSSTYYTVTTSASSTSYKYLSFYLTLPKDNVIKQYSDLYLLTDFSHYHSSYGDIRVFVSVYALDMYDREMNSTVVNARVNVTSGGTVSETLEPSSPTGWNYLSGSYFDIAREDEWFHKGKLSFNISSILNDTKSLNIFNKIKVVYSIRTVMGSGTYTANFKEIGLIGKRSISITDSEIFCTQIGETFGSTWNGRKTSTEPILNIVDTFEHLVRNYDEYQPPWKASKAYIIGDKIKSTVDNSNIFICVTAGTSHASTEPSWTDTVGATYTDNTATWRQYKALSIDEDSFDDTRVLRTDWLIGHTITEKKQTVEYLTQLCKQGYLIASITPAGKIKVKSWLDDVTPSITFDSSNILPNSLSDVTLTPIRRSYNEFKVNYDWNYGSKKFNKSISITNVDRPAFPSVREVVGNTNALSSYSMVIGWGGGEYYSLLVTSTSHGLETGQYVYLEGSSNGNDFDALQVVVASADNFYMVTNIKPNSMGTTSTGSHGGVMYKVEVNNLKWKTYVSGIDNYNTAKTLWNRCNESYRYHKTINKLPDDLGDCDFYFDPYAQDPLKNYIWQTDNVLDLDIGDEHAAYFYLLKLVEWVTWRKKQITLNVPDNSTYSAIELGDPVYVNDAKLTAGAALLGWVHSKRQNPRDEHRMESFTFGITFKPEEFVDHYVIDENFATDIIDENGATNIYDENGA